MLLLGLLLRLPVLLRGPPRLLALLRPPGLLRLSSPLSSLGLLTSFPYFPSSTFLLFLPFLETLDFSTSSTSWDFFFLPWTFSSSCELVPIYPYPLVRSFLYFFISLDSKRFDPPFIPFLISFDRTYCRFSFTLDRTLEPSSQA